MQPKNTGFADRISTSNDAKKALLAKFKPKPMVNDPELESREKRKAAELEAVRAQRQAEKEQVKAARAAAREEAEKARIAAQLADLEAKRNATKTRKSMEKQEAQARRAARMELYGRVSSSASQSSFDTE